MSDTVLIVTNDHDEHADRHRRTPVALNVLALVLPESVAFRLDAAGGRWAIDDVYVDPYGKG